jgi:hypothetical protein
MNWRVKPEPKEGDLRLRKGFLFRPMTIAKRAKWLERASWVELYQRTAYGLDWQPISWREVREEPTDGKGFWCKVYQRFFNQQTLKINL